MTDRQTQAVAEAIAAYHTDDVERWHEELAYKVIAASDAKYVPGLVEALRFYAAESTYRRRKGPLKNCERSWKNPEIFDDAGRKAIEALAQLPEDLR